MSVKSFNTDDTLSSSKPKRKSTKSKKKSDSAKNLLKVIKSEEEGSSELTSQSPATKRAPIKQLQSKYGADVDIARAKSMIPNVIERIATRAEGAVESAFFYYEEVDKEQKSGDASLVTIDTEKNGLDSGLTLAGGGASKRRLTFDQDSMAL